MYAMHRGCCLPQFLMAMGCLFAFACAGHDASGQRRGVTRELLEMAQKDQEVRELLVQHLRKNETGEISPDLQRRMSEVDTENLARLQLIVDEHGWPTISLVGREAAEAAWLLAQHADVDPEFQARVLELMEPLVEKGEVSARNFALLTDRVLVGQGKPQLYGTQYTRIVIDGVVHFGPSTPISDPDRLAERRSALNLTPHAEYVRGLRRMLGVPDGAPPLPPGHSGRSYLQEPRKVAGDADPP